MGILSSLFGWISKLFKQLVNLFKKILPYLMVALAIVLLLTPAGLPLSAWFGAAFAGVVIPGGVVGAMLAIGTSFLFAPDETAELVNDAIDAVGDVAQNVLEEGVELLGSVASTVLSNPIVLAGAVFALWWFFGRDKKEKDPDQLAGDGPSPLQLSRQASMAAGVFPPPALPRGGQQ